MNNPVEYQGKNKKKLDFKKYNDNALHSLNEVEKFLNCVTKVKNYTSIFRLFK